MDASTLPSDILTDEARAALANFTEKCTSAAVQAPMEPSSVCIDMQMMADKLLSLCVSCASPSDCSLIFDSLRHSLRDSKALSSVIEQHARVFACLVKHFEDTIVSSSKLLVNMLLAAPKTVKPQLLSCLASLQFGATVCTVMTQVSFEADAEVSWVLCRLAVHVTADATLRAQFSSAEPIIGAVEYYEGVAGDTKDAKQLQCLSDSLRVLFNFTMEYGPLSAAAASAAKEYPLTAESAPDDGFPEHVERLFTRVSPVLNRILAWNYQEGPQGVRDVYTSGVALAINMSKRFLLKFDAHVALPNLIGVLSFCIDQPGKLDESTIAPLLMLLTKVSKEIPETRSLFFMNIFPRWKEILGDESETDGVVVPPEHEGTVGGQIITKLMTSSAVTLQFYSAEFVLVMCGGNAGAFTRMCGFGSAAGHLAVRGLMNMGASEDSAVDTGSSSSAPSAPSAASAASGGGVPGPIRAPPQPDNMSEQDIADWNELMDKIEKLNKLGVIKMMGPGDGGEGQ